MMSEELLRLRATCASNKSVITKLIAEEEQIAQLETKQKDQLKRITLMLEQKWNLLNEYNDKILALCKVEDIEKEIEAAHDLTIRIMDMEAEITKLTMPSTIIETPPSSSNLAMSPIKPSPSSLNVATTFPIKPSPFSSDVVTMPPIRTIAFLLKCRDNDCYLPFDFKFLCCRRFKPAADYMV